jgi:3-hydroxymyristoyl/3-hydroxydecanoyl-(acyl carrier protein) dehydratase
VAESGINTEEILLERDVALPATTALQSVSFKLPALPMASYQLRADALESDKVVSTARDIFVVTDRPLRAGQ